MSFDSHQLFDLLPAVLRLRDAAGAGISLGWLEPRDRRDFLELRALKDAGALVPAQEDELLRLEKRALAGPLASLVAVLAEQIGALEEDLEQLYDDQFIETCADWVAPYIGDLIGYRVLHGVTPKIASPRAEVAHTIGYRRRKGTVVVLEQLARDVTEWKANAVELFQRLVVTQYMNHPRPHCLASPDLRRWRALEQIGGAFDPIMHSVDVRRIASGRGRYNIPNVGIFLWRIDAFPLEASPAVALDARRWRFHPLGIDQPLYNNPQAAELWTLATEHNVPHPIGRRDLDADVREKNPEDRIYYTEPTGDRRSLCLYENSSGAFAPVPLAEIRVCNLADSSGTWAHLPTDHVFAVDPLLGRIAAPPDLAPGTQIRADFHYGFSAPLGSGEYDRESPPLAEAPTLRVPNDFATIQKALDQLPATGGAVVVTDSGRYEETLTLAAASGAHIELRAEADCRPTIVLAAEAKLSGGKDASIRLDGLLIAGAPLRVPATGGNQLRSLELSHCTLVPGWSLQADSSPLHPDQASLVIELPEVEVIITRSIVGGVRSDPTAKVSAADSFIDATAPTRTAYAAPDGTQAGGALRLESCTVIGKIHALELPYVSSAILLAQLAEADTWPAPIRAERRQAGCIRFSYLSPGARVPPRYRCLPEAAASAADAVPRFTTLRYGFAAYGQLADTSGARLLTGGEDDLQPGAFRFLCHAQRESNLRVRLDEYLRVGMEAGIFHQS